MERFLNYFEPSKYSLDLTIDKEKETIECFETIFGMAYNETVKFHAVDLDIENVFVDGEKTKYKYDGKVLEISGLEVDDEASIDILYKTKLNKNMQGAYVSTYEYKGKTQKIVATQFESHYAREAFVCVDEPEAKATFDVEINVPGRDDVVLFNMPADDFTFYYEDGVEYTKTYFHGTPRMSTYLLAFVVGEFNVLQGFTKYDTLVTTYVPKNHPESDGEFANEMAVKALEFYEDNFGIEYPLPKLSQVALPDFEAGAMENWGLVTYRETALLVPKTATLSTKKSVALTVAHELAHQWFGNLVTMKWWDDLWLNESFASVMEYYAVDAIHPEYKIWEGFFTGDCLAALKRDCISGVQSVQQDVEDPEEIATLFDSAIVYAKGARLILMLIRLMGWKKFCKGCHEYFLEYGYDNTNGDHLWEAMNKYADFDVPKMMHAFIEQPGYPVITSMGKGGGVSEHFALPETDFGEIQQKRFLIDGEMVESDWPLPEIKEDMSGHYILNLSDAEFEERLSRFDSLDLEEKLRLLIDRYLLSKTDLVSSASLLPLISKFKNEDSAAVWSIILTIVSEMKIFFEYGSKEEKEFKKFVKDLVSEKLNEIGISTRKKDDENIVRLRSILLALDFYAEDKEILEKLSSMYADKYAKLDSEIRSDILDAKVYLEPSMTDAYLSEYAKISDPEIKFDLLFATTLTKDKKALSKVMKLLNEPEIVKPQDQFYLFIYLFRNPEIRAEIFEWLPKNWEYVKEISGDKSLDSYPRYMATSIRTKEDYKKYLDFYGPLENEPALSRAIEMGKNEIEAKLKLIASDQKAVHKELINLS